MVEIYKGNPNLKSALTQSEYGEKELAEFIRCSKDPIYFIEEYVKIISLDEGLIPFKLYPFQKEIIGTFHNNRFTICKLPRQSGKSTTIIGYLIHFAIFNESTNVAILANKASTARDLLARFQLAYENLPSWMQMGVLNWNKGSLELENGSRIIAASTSASAIRGMTFNIIFLDEFAFIPSHIAEQFFASVYPTITSGKSSKVMIVSTPHGMNMYYRMWMDAVNEKSEFIPIEVHWSEVPGRDEKWKESTIANTSERQFQQEFECSFLGSIDTLISVLKLQEMPYWEPIEKNAGLDIFERPEKEHDYCVSVDVARGGSKDYSAFVVLDITTLPYKLVAKYRSNEIKPLIFPEIIHKVARNYNNAHLLVEINDIGGQVADALHYDMAYENIIMTQLRGRLGQVVGGGFGDSATDLGIRTTKSLKRIGCSNLKQLIEGDKLEIHDFDVIVELSNFIQKGQSFEAEEGASDDLVMCLVFFAWLTDQQYFKEMTDEDIRKRLFESQKENIEADMAPFGFIDDGILDLDAAFVDEDGDYWRPTDMPNVFDVETH
ncbi:MAG: terminase [Anaerolineaceae bacterium]|mgnify:FL=1|jgi:hypothetical protein|nr:terminase [Anaerolineaceae bacterium]MDP7366949.1 terminase family protein [Candidatus Paceibacterota bacterium]|tara:strand:- start:875 stop:2521 length:1647 start_codon:yes stop_codon:yes gene_type:complete